MRKFISFLLSAAIAAGTASVSVSFAEDKPFGELTSSYMSMVKSCNVVFDGDKALVHYDMVCKNFDPPCVFDEYDWELEGTASADMETGIVYDEDCMGYAAGYCIITAKTPGILKVSAYFTDQETGERLDYEPEVIYLTVGADGRFEEKVDIRPPYDGTVEGDINGDGEFTIADVVTIYRYIIGKTGVLPERWKAADLCCDGELNVYDLVVLRKKLADLNLDPSIEFTAESFKYGGTYYPNRKAVLCTTVEELVDAMKYTKEPFAESPKLLSNYDKYASKYDEAFFESNSLIYVRDQQSSSSNEETIKKVRKKADGTFSVEINVFIPSVMAFDMAPWEHFIVVDKSEKGDVTAEFIKEYQTFK